MLDPFALIIGHISFNMLSILNKLTLQKKLHIFVTDNVFWTKKLKHNNNKIKHKKPCRSRDFNPGPLAPKRMRYLCTTESTESIDCSQAI